MGASAYQNGNIEFIVLRQGKQGGEDLVQGKYLEALSDYSEDNKGINITYKFKLAITENREQLYKLIYKNQNLKQSTLMRFFTESPPKFVDSTIVAM
jgi:hypothetical protein